MRYACQMPMNEGICHREATYNCVDAAPTCFQHKSSCCIRFYGFVKSHYRASWKGIVLYSQERTMKRDMSDSPLLTVLVLKDRHDNPPQRRIIHTLDKSWTTPIEAVSLRGFPKEWFWLNARK